MPSLRKLLSCLLLAALLGPGPLAQAQNVGIGTSAPTQALDVNGQVRLRGLAGDAAGRLLGLADDGTLQAQPPAFGAATPAFMPTPPVDLGVLPTSTTPQAIVLDPTATRAYVTSQAGQLDAYDLGLNGLPVWRGTVPTGSSPRALAMHPAGTRLYVANNTENRLQTYDITGGGLPVSLGVVRTGRGPVGVVLHPAGTRAYVLNYVGNTLQAFDLSGSLPLSLDSIGTTGNSAAVALNAAGTRAYVTTVASTLHTFDTGSIPRPLAVSAGGAAAGLGVAPLPGAGRLPAAYGAVGSGGAALGAAGGFSVAHPALGVYRLSFSSSPLRTTDLGQAAVVAALAGVAPGSVSYRTGPGYVEILTYAPGGAATDRGFTFSVALP